MLSPIEEIRQRLDIVDFISEYLPLKKAGANYKALCPFHSEKTPSFMVSRAKQIWHCFGCNEGGDIFKFLMKMEGLEFGEALRILAQKAGVELPQYDPRLKTLRNTLLNILETAKDFFVDSLRSESGKKAREYLANRGLDEKTIKLFELGYAPNNWDALYNELKKKFRPEDILAAGLIVKSEKGSEEKLASSYYDRFRHRLIFPIHDIYGNVVGFTGRILEENQSGGKYINTPETMVYNKGKILYGLDLAKNAIREKDLAIVVEGNMDVITSHQFGFQNTVASSGTALTIDQLRLIKRYTLNIALAFDADLAGQTAAKRGIDLALEEGMQVRVIEIPKGAGKDPDECIRKNKDLWQEALNEAREVMEWYFQKAKEKYNLKTAQGQRDFVTFLLKEVARLPSLVEQDFWLKKISKVLDINLEVLRQEMKKNKTHLKTAVTAVIQLSKEKPRKKMLEERLLSLLAFSPDLLPLIIDRVLVEFFSDSQEKDLYLKFIKWYNQDNRMREKSDFSDWLKEEDEEIFNFFVLKELEGTKDFDGWTEEQLEKEIKFVVNSLRQEFLKERRIELSKAMEEAEKKGDREKILELAKAFEEINVQEN